MKKDALFRASIKFIDNPMDGFATHNVQLLKVGKFYHPQYGDIDITTAYLQSMVKNFADNVRGIDLAIDYAHNNDSIAAGWIETVYLSGDNDSELWAKVRWTAKGSQIVTDKEFRYLSAEFHNDYVNNETQKSYGPTLLGAGLTNRPFVKGMHPVLELSEKPIEGNKNMPDDKDKMISDLQAQVADLQKKLDAAKPAPDSGSEELADMKKKVAAYEAAAAESNKTKALAEKKALFDGLMVSGKAVEAQREAFMSGDTVKFAENFVAPNLGGKGSSIDAPAVEAKDKSEATAQIIALAEKHLADKKVKTIGEGQALALKENPELFKKIYS